MNNIISVFNLYNIRVRMSVTVVLLAPFILQLYLLFEEFRELSTTVVVILIGLALGNIVMLHSRMLGATAMKKCFPNGMPAQKYLLPSSDYLDDDTKKRYYRFFKKNINDFVISEVDEEMENSIKTSVNWLIAQTRNTDDFPLINEENINFGFSYTLLGLKKYGIIISIVMLLTNTALMSCVMGPSIQLDIDLFNLIYLFMIDSMFLFVWIFMVNKKLVRNSAKKYARALLSACDSPILNKK